jgi:hypothetical protein
VVVVVVVVGSGMSVLVPVVGGVVALVRELSVDVVVAAGAAVATGAVMAAADDVAGAEVVGLTATDPVVGAVVFNKLRSCVVLEIGSVCVELVTAEVGTTLTGGGATLLAAGLKIDVIVFVGLLSVVLGTVATAANVVVVGATAASRSGGEK